MSGSSTLSPRAPYIGNAALDGARVSGAMTADIVGEWIDVRRLDAICFREYWPATGTPVGTLTFEAALTEQAPQQTADIFEVDAATSWDNPTGAAGSNTITIDLRKLRVSWLRRKYTRVSGGTGATLVVRIAGRGE